VTSPDGFIVDSAWKAILMQSAVSKKRAHYYVVSSKTRRLHCERVFAFIDWVVLLSYTALASS
jgi:hypothetical protein